MADLPEIYNIKTDLGELKTTVSVIKEKISTVDDLKDELAEMRSVMTRALDRMTESLVKLASVTEKINHNVEEHKAIHNRIDEMEASNATITESIQTIREDHIRHMTEIELEERLKKESPFEIAKKNFLVWFFMVMFGLSLFVLIIHGVDFSKFTKGNGDLAPVSTTVPK